MASAKKHYSLTTSNFQLMQQDNYSFNIKQTALPSRGRGLFLLLTGYRGLYLAALVGVGLAALANTGVYLVVGRFVDNVLPSGNIVNQLPLYALGVVGLALLQGLFSATSGRWAAFASERVVKRLRDFLYDHLQRLSFTYHDRMQTGELLSRATSDVDTIRKLFAEQAIGIGRIATLFLVNFSVLLWIDVRYALVSVAVIPFVLAISYIFFAVIGRRYEKFQEQEAQLTNQLQEALAGVRVVRAFGRSQHEIERFEVENHKKYLEGKNLTRAHAAYWPSTDLLCGGQVVFSLWYGARMALNDEISIGLFIVSIGLVNQLIWPIRNLGRFLSEISMALVSFGRIRDIIEQTREPLTDANSITPPATIHGDITFKNLNFNYAGEETTVLHDINFELAAGQTVALLGSTGSGKTTLVNLLPRFYDYANGSITLDGIELNRYPRDFLRQRIGIVMQEAFLFATTIRENITYGAGREVSDDEVFAAAEAAAVHDVILGFPDGYDTVVGERGVTLSGGQKQRVALARTILQQPDILILDDSTSAVDTETETQIRDAMLGAADNRTTFIIAHRIQSVMHADLILVMDKGHITERGSHYELLEQGGTYRRIYELQASIESDLAAEINFVGTQHAAPLPA